MDLPATVIAAQVAVAAQQVHPVLASWSLGWMTAWPIEAMRWHGCPSAPPEQGLARLQEP
ncbi:MAG: hypothetical protein GTN62_02420 [Gemmatimonadales bacterium]|nr:hypothetical protein [Gemmatimonadales bacterium]NIN10199.1 hypothetical protein [Gemmatimonadales bacterium]NIN48955.1 hypothetical protein [Gemmatimonadales bacterium]NIP06419.1 hypothetical protein [Gemmatimonadales bacterium]NIQ98771.1 hypothetical protein [Gemmatimonadales bacterium]